MPIEYTPGCKLVLRWGTVDVDTVAQEMGIYDFTDAEAEAVLKSIESEYSADTGVTWQTLEVHVQKIFLRR